MGHDFTSDDRDEPSTDRSRLLRTDGGSEAEQEASDEGGENEATSETESESGSQSESGSDSESEETEADGEAEESTEDEGEAAQKADESEEQDETPAEPAQIEADDEAVAEQTGDVGVEPQPDAESEVESDQAEDESTLSLDRGGDTASIIEVRNQVIELSTDVIGRSLDGIVEVSRNEDNWRAVVEIIERRSVPDTQDILGQYEIELDEQGEVIGYRRLEKYRRSDTGPSQH